MSLSRLYSLWRRLYVWASRKLTWIDYGLSFLRNHRQLLRAWPEGPASEVPLGPRVAIFVHFDRVGRVGRHVLHYVAALQAAGLSVIFVTNSGMLQDASLAALRPLCAGILVRRNVGYDFGAMREGMEHFSLPRADTDMVLLINDSVYGPLAPLDSLLSQIDLGAADVWGLTESWQTRYHLQSYFIAIGRAALTSPAWRGFWKTVRPVRSKDWVVHNYEVGLTQKLLRAGIRCGAVWPYHDLVDRVDPSLLIEVSKDGPTLPDPQQERRRIQAHRIRHWSSSQTPLNPTSDLWRELLESGFPFVKRELLRDNPTLVADVAQWREVAMRVYGAVPEPIMDDLHRVLRNRAA